MTAALRFKIVSGDLADTPIREPVKFGEVEGDERLLLRTGPAPEPGLSEPGVGWPVESLHLEGRSGVPSSKCSDVGRAGPG